VKRAEEISSLWKKDSKGRKEMAGGKPTLRTNRRGKKERKKAFVLSKKSFWKKKNKWEKKTKSHAVNIETWREDGGSTFGKKDTQKRPLLTRFGNIKKEDMRRGDGKRILRGPHFERTGAGKFHERESTYRLRKRGEERGKGGRREGPGEGILLRQEVPRRRGESLVKREIPH